MFQMIQIIPQIWPPSLCRVLANSRGEMPGQLSSEENPEVPENAKTQVPRIK